MDQKEINEQFFKRLEKLEKSVFSEDIKSNRSKASSKTDITSLPNIILKLRANGFFKHPQSVREVHKKVLSVYHCSIDRVGMALKRLKDRKKLRITNKILNNKKVLAYVW